jgi:hypothetical protein
VVISNCGNGYATYCRGKSIADDGIRQVYRSIALPKSADFSADDEIQASSWIADLERLALISRDNVFSVSF